jgi:hypothetical protein
MTGEMPGQARHPAYRGRRVGGPHADGLVGERREQKLNVRPEAG